MPILSLIIPLFNTEKYIGECLSSIIDNNANKTDYEVIVVNDGSTDASEAIVKSICEQYNNVKIISQKNQGVGVARMNGVMEATGDYIWFIDSDDYIVEGALSIILDTIHRYEDIDVFVTPMRLEFEDGREGFTTHELNERYVISGKDLLKRKDFLLIGPPQFIIKRKLFKNKWLYFPKDARYEDEYFARVLKYIGNNFLILEEYLYVYRQWSGSHMNSVQVTRGNDVITIYKHLDRFANEVVSIEDQPWFRYNIVSFLFESYTRNRSFFGTKEFKAFRKKNKSFIRSEWGKYKKYFPVKDQALANLLLASPVLYVKLLNLYQAWKYKHQ